MEENCQENNAMNDILKSVEVRGRIERLIELAKGDKAKCMGEYEQEGRREMNHPMNVIRPMEKACRADRLKHLLRIIYNNGMEGYSNTDDQIYDWLIDCIR